MSQPVPFHIVYPLLPSMDPRELPYFHKGAQIALDNILEDYLGNPEMSLFEVIADLEDKRPVVGVVKEDWERRCVVGSARWVGEAVAGWWEEWFGKDEGSEDEWEDEDEDEGQNKSEDEVMGETAFETVNDVGEGDEIEQRGDLMVERDGSQSGAEREKTGHDFASSGPNDTDIVQQEVEEATNENIAARSTGKPHNSHSTVHETPELEEVISPLAKVGEKSVPHDDEAGELAADDEDKTDEEQTRQNEKGARVVACMLRLLGRWIELQIDHASKTG